MFGRAARIYLSWEPARNGAKPSLPRHGLGYAPTRVLVLVAVPQGRFLLTAPFAARVLGLCNREPHLQSICPGPGTPPELTAVRKAEQVSATEQSHCLEGWGSYLLGH